MARSSRNGVAVGREREVALEVGGVSLRLFAPRGPALDAVADRFANRAHGFGEVLPERRSLHVSVERGVARIEHEGHEGFIVLESGEIHAPAHAVLADALVRAAVAWRLAQRGSLYLHASAVRTPTARGVGAVVFFGASGAGKSTLATAYGDFISDELSQMDSTPESAVAPFRVSPTPWWHGSGEAAPLVQLVWIVRGERPSARRIGGAELLRALLRESGRYFPVAEFETRIFDLCARLARCGAIRVAAGEGRVVADVEAALATHRLAV